MIRPTVLRNSAEPEIVIGIALKIFYNANDWVDNSTFLDKLDIEYDAIGKQRETRSGGQAIAKYKPALYYGLLDAREDGAHIINDFGRRYYEAYVSKNEDEMVDCLIASISSHTFGSNNPAVPESRSKIEPPKVFLVSCLLLNNKLSKNEYAYILESLSNDNDYKKILVDVSLSRLKGSELIISDYAKNNYRDDKGLKFLSDAGLFDDVSKGTKAIKDKYFIKYSEVLSSLTIISEEETIKGVSITYHYNPETITHMNYLTAIRTKPFILLAGISGTGKSRIVRKLAQATDDIDVLVNDEERWKCPRPANFELIQVKPNWHNSMDVVGFQSNIPVPHYEFTPFVDFVVKAWCHEDTPFFLCLDEMNLAPVEEYFAEFLSAIESRSIGEDGEFETDPIIKPFDSFGSELAGKMMRHFVEMGYDLPKKVETRLREKGLTLPKNLIVMGTVNMDETTFSFSRKVLDRAMSIEMNEVDYDGFIEGKTEYNIPKLTEQNGLFVNRPISAQEVKEEIASQEVMDFLKGVNDILDGTPFKLGYRAANEAILYVAADKVVGANNLNTALDDFTLMKILSRIEGDDSKLVTKDGDKLLDKLNEYFSNVFGANESKSLAKLANMIATLKRDHFVSFWG